MAGAVTGMRSKCGGSSGRVPRAGYAIATAADCKSNSPAAIGMKMLFSQIVAHAVRHKQA